MYSSFFSCGVFRTFFPGGPLKGLMLGLGEEVGCLTGRTRPGVFSFRLDLAGVFDSGGGVEGGGTFSWSFAGEDASEAFLFLLAEADFVLGELVAFVLPFWRFVPLRSDTILIDVKMM